jgi:hypothetical protein
MMIESNSLRLGLPGSVRQLREGLAVAERMKLKRDESIDLQITYFEREVMLKETMIDQELFDMLEGTREEDEGLVISLTLEDLDHLLGFVAAEANHTEDATLQGALDALSERLSAIEDQYDLVDE